MTKAMIMLDLLKLESLNAMTVRPLLHKLLRVKFPLQPLSALCADGATLGSQVWQT
jgi:hypothetical protein